MRVAFIHRPVGLALVVMCPLAGACPPDDGAPDDGAPDAGPADAGPSGAPSGLALNEAMSRNAATVQDAAGEFDDWLELYNPADAAIRLDGFTLADGAGVPTPFPEGAQVPARGFLLIFADDTPEQGSAIEPHFPFKLSGNTGEPLVLRDPDGALVDNLTLPVLEQDRSFGRVPDGRASAQVLGVASPGASNVGPAGSG